jgi:hypothetical protein
VVDSWYPQKTEGCVSVAVNNGVAYGERCILH